MGGGDFVRISNWRRYLISAFCSQHRFMNTMCVMHQVFWDDRFLILNLSFSDISIFFKKYFRLLHTELQHSCVQNRRKCCTYVLRKYLQRGGGHPVQNGSPHRQESLVSPPEGSPDRSATGARSLGISSDTLRSRPSLCTTSRFNPHASLQHASVRHPAGNTPLPEVVVFDMNIMRIASFNERQKYERRAS